MKFKPRTLLEFGDLICGNAENEKEQYLPYRSSMYITEFFADIETDYTHDGTTRHRWVAAVLDHMLDEPQSFPGQPPDVFLRVINRLMDADDCMNEGRDRPQALKLLNAALHREGFEAFCAENGHCYLRNTTTNTIAAAPPSPHRPLSAAERQRRADLMRYLDRASEDELIEQVLLPLFGQLGFHRITAAGHKDKALEYGKDVWMKYVLPTQHVLYFGIQAKGASLTRPA